MISLTRSAAVDLIFAALAKAQAEMHSAGLTAENPFFKSRYAPLGEIVRVSRPALAKNSLCVIQGTEVGDDGITYLITILGHSSGQWIESRMRVSPQKQDVQSLGGYISYLRRYMYSSLVGVVIGEDDDDGEGSVVREQPAKPIPYQNLNETISQDQLTMLEDELQENIDLTANILKAYQVKSLKDLPRGRFNAVLGRIREINALKAANPK